MRLYEMGYVEEMRQRLGFNKDDPYIKEELESRPPFNRVRLIIGWYLGDESWADKFRDILESQCLYITTNSKDKV